MKQNNVEPWACFTITIAVACVGAYGAARAKLPAGPMIGAMFIVVLLNILWGQAYVPESLRVIIRMVAGALIGSRIFKKDVIALKTMIGSASILVLGLVVLGVAAGLLVFSISHLDLATSLFASAPGGMTDMALIADELGADAPKVALLQLLRILTVLGIFPILLRSICTRHARKNPPLQNGDMIEKDRQQEQKPPSNIIKKTAITLGIGIIGGLFGIWIDIPAGAMIGAMLLVALYNVFSNKAYMPRKVRVVAQVTIGALLGSGMNMDDVIGMQEILIPGLILVFGMIALNMCIGFFIYKLSNLDLATALFASVPGGVTEMTLIAADLGADTPKVALLQLLRLMSVIILFPSLLTYLVVALGG